MCFMFNIIQMDWWNILIKNRATVRLGEMDERSNPDCEGDVCADEPQDFTPLVIIAHRNYNVPKYKNDIGLIRLDREAIITRK